MKTQIYRNTELFGFTRKDIAIMREELKNQIENQHIWFRSIEERMAAMTKILSSIEMEMLLKRDGCLDNNFEGKEKM